MITFTLPVSSLVRMNKVDLPAVTAERVLGMIALRETTQKLLDCQLHDGTDAEVELLQGKLKDQYKRFTAQYGLINSTANKRASTADGKADEPEAVTTPDGTLSEVL